MIKFETAVAHFIDKEGKIEENPHDINSITKYGISLRFLKSLTSDQLREYGFPSDPALINKEDIIQLTPTIAKFLYFGMFWKDLPFERINNNNVVNYLFDMVVKMGASPAVKCLQRACWAVMRDNKIVKEDGILSEVTLGCINFCGDLLLPPLRAERAAEYKLLANEKPDVRIKLEALLDSVYANI